MKIDHIGIATRQLEEAKALWQDSLGLKIDSTEDVDDQGVRVAMLPIGETRIELLEPITASSPIEKFWIRGDREFTILRFGSTILPLL